MPRLCSRMGSILTYSASTFRLPSRETGVWLGKREEASGRARKLFRLPKRGVSATAHCGGQLSHAEEGQAAVLPCDDLMGSSVGGTVGPLTWD